ncbi:MAG: DUF1343 domain-containing protein [Taibaiella sp.]|nr:DUF1343 domain-containing protein [Taibaiella sp.]
MKIVLTASLIVVTLAVAQSGKCKDVFDANIRPGAFNTSLYCHLLNGKNVGVIVNQTSRISDSSLVDVLLARQIAVKKIFVPEHGFRGREDAGAHIDNMTDSATGLPVISLYGSHKKPTPADYDGLDVIVYDLQDVGVRFYTYISTLEYCMEAAAEQQKTFIVLDRPNPNGFYVDGPVMETKYKSFVGMQQIPVVYGMTAGEYASMITGEHWYSKAATLQLTVIKCSGYDHTKKYQLPVSPSPNLRTMGAVYAYPSLCFFEGTKISVGRGTALPFQQYGAPELAGNFQYSFIPESGPGAKKPMYEHMVCYGELVGNEPEKVLTETGGKLQLKWLIKAYKAYPEKDKFFTDFLQKLAGTAKLQYDIEHNKNVAAIRKSWQNDLLKFKKMRKKYLLYRDFE